MLWYDVYWVYWELFDNLLHLSREQVPTSVLLLPRNSFFYDLSVVHWAGLMIFFRYALIDGGFHVGSHRCGFKVQRCVPSGVPYLFDRSEFFSHEQRVSGDMQCCFSDLHWVNTAGWESIALYFCLSFFVNKYGQRLVGRKKTPARTLLVKETNVRWEVSGAASVAPCSDKEFTVYQEHKFYRFSRLGA